jgi:hypothetical protein
MKHSRKTAIGIAAALGLGLAVATAFAQPFGAGPGMRQGMGHGANAGGHGPMAGPVAMLTTQDAGSAADMDLVHDLLTNHTKIKRTVTNLPNGIKTVTESDDPQVAQAIKAHVASMSQRLGDGREFNIFSTTLPVLFENADKIKSTVEMTEKGSVVTRTSNDAKVVTALLGHAAEVTELAQEGPVAMRRGMMTRMAAGPRGMQPRQGPGVPPVAPRGNSAPAAGEHAH